MGADQSLPAELPPRSPRSSVSRSAAEDPAEALDAPGRVPSFARAARTRGGQSNDPSIMKQVLEQRYKAGGAAKRLARMRAAKEAEERGDGDAAGAPAAGKHLFQKRMSFWDQMQLVVGSESQASMAASEAAGGGAAEAADDEKRRAKEAAAAREAKEAREAEERRAKQRAAPAAAAAAPEAALSKEERRAYQRERIVREIIESEQLYSSFLQLMLEKYLIPIREGGILDEADVARVFANFETFAPYHELFANELSKSEGRVSEGFSKYVHYLKMYMPYVNNYDAAMETMGRHKKDKKFQAFLADRRRDPELGGLDLTSFLIMPIQRIPRYRMLLTQLDRYTDEEHDEKAELQKSLALVTEIADRVNATKRQYEHLTKLLEVHNRIQGCVDFDLIQPHRQLLREASMLRKKKSSKEAHVFLFNDILLWTTPSPGYDFKGVIRLAAATLGDYEHKSKLGFRVVCQNMPQDLVLLQASAEERDSWIASVSGAIESAKEARAARRELNLGSRGRAVSHRNRNEMASRIQKSLRGLNGTLKTRLAALSAEDEDVTFASATLQGGIDPNSDEYKERMAEAAAEAAEKDEAAAGAAGDAGAAGAAAPPKRNGTLRRDRPRPPLPKGPPPAKAKRSTGK